jgi:CO/xanthine dehydrogenase FAD-binding subunit
VDLNTVEVVSVPTCRGELWPLGAGDAVLAGGTWLFSEPQPHLRRLVDITAMGWQPIAVSDNGIELAATCTVAEVSRLSAALLASRPDWVAAPLLHHCCAAVLASFKILGSATVGGNICLSFPAGAMISLASALEGRVTVWRADGGDYELPVAQFVTVWEPTCWPPATCCGLCICQLPRCGRAPRFANWRRRRWAGPVSW